MARSRVMFAVSTPESIDGGVLGKVAHLVTALGAQLELFNCLYEPHAVPRGWGSHEIEQRVRDLVEQRHRQLEITAERLRACGIGVRTTVRWDTPAHEGIIRQVLRHKPDLLVAQSTRRSRVARLVLSHTDYRLIEACPCPVLLIKTARPYSRPCILAAVDPLHQHDKPAALDAAILATAGELSRALGARLRVYHACARWPAVAGGRAAFRSIVAPVEAEVHAAYCEQTEARVAELVRAEKVPEVRIHVEEGNAARTLPRFAKSVSADIVAMGAVSRSIPRRALLGHTAEQVLDILDCDLLIVKPPAFRCPVSSRSVHRLPKHGALRAKYTHLS
jgi:universal stress protein E